MNILYVALIVISSSASIGSLFLLIDIKFEIKGIKRALKHLDSGNSEIIRKHKEIQEETTDKIELIKQQFSTKKASAKLSVDETIDLLLKELSEEGIHSIQVEMDYDEFFRTSRKKGGYSSVLNRETPKLIYFSYDSEPEMFEKYLNSKKGNISRFDIHSGEIRNSFKDNTFRMEIEKLNKEFEKVINNDGMIALKDAYKNIIKKSVGEKLTKHMNL